MPLTETQPINIQDLVIESNFDTVKPWFKLEDDVPNELIEEMRNLENSPRVLAEKKILGLISEVSDEEKKQLILELDSERSLTQNSPFFSNSLYATWALTNIAYNLRCLGIPTHFSIPEYKFLSESIEAIDVAILHAFGYTTTIPEPTFDTLARIGSFPIDDIDTLVAYQVLGQPIALSRTQKTDLKNSILEIDHIPTLLSHTSKLAILAADEIRFGQNGIELIRKTPSNFKTAPPIPSVRNF